MIGRKEYVIGEDKKVDIEYGADVFDIYCNTAAFLSPMLQSQQL